MFSPSSRGGANPVLLGEAIERHQLGLLGDADGALALHVGMAAHRADARADAADVAAHQQQVDEHPHRLDARPVLRQAHAVDRDRRRCARIDGRGGREARARQARTPLQLLPALRAQPDREVFEPVRMLGEERVIEDRSVAALAGLVVYLQQPLADAGECGEVAGRLHLVVLAADPRLVPGQHLRRRLRVDEADQALLAQRVVGDDRHAAPARLLQRVQHAGAVAAGVLAEEQKAVRLGEIVQRDGADRHPEALRQRYGRGLVAHVGAVRQIVVAVQPGEQCVQVARLVRRASRAVEDDAATVLHRPQLAADLPERLVPRD